MLKNDLTHHIMIKKEKDHCLKKKKVIELMKDEKGHITTCKNML